MAFPPDGWAGELSFTVPTAPKTRPASRSRTGSAAFGSAECEQIVVVDDCAAPAAALPFYFLRLVHSDLPISDPVFVYADHLAHTLRLSAKRRMAQEAA